MLPVQPLRSSQEIYIGARLLVSLYDAGVGLCEAVTALEPIAECLWQSYREEEDEDAFANRIFHLRADPSVVVTAEVECLDGDRQCMGICIERRGSFTIQLWCDGEEGGDFIPFADAEPTIGMEAKDVNELATFLTLTRTLGGELEADS
jgi:hypothetical protein